MKRPILIIRTVSIEKLSQVIASCKEQWPFHPVWVLTLPGREGELEVDSRINRVIVFPSETGEFQGYYETPDYFEVLAIPTVNHSGWGYANVYRALSTIHTRQVFRVAYCKRWIRTSYFRLMARCLWEMSWGYICSPVGRLLGKRWVQIALSRPQRNCKDFLHKIHL